MLQLPENLPDLLRTAFGDNTEKLISVAGVKSDKDAKVLFNNAFSAVCFTYPHDVWTKNVAAQNKPVYEYFFTKENGEISTNHSGELIYAYRNVPKSKNYDSADYDLENTMSSYWVNFVKTGNHNGLRCDGEVLPEWKIFTESNGSLLELGESVKMRSDPYSYMYEYIVKAPKI